MTITLTVKLTYFLRSYCIIASGITLLCKAINMNKILAKAAFALLGLYILYVLTDRLLLHKNSKRYRNFGINVPAGYTVHGIDVSKYQKDINWELVSKMRDQGAKLDFAIIKFTEGVNLVDRYATTNYREAKAQNLLVGAYLYFRPTQNGTAQARHFIKHSKLVEGDLAPVVDIEELDGANKTTMLTNLMACLAELQEHYGCKSIVYSGANFYNQYLSDSCKGFPLWVAHYYEGAPDIARDYVMWQHNDKGTVDGIDAPVDFNVAAGSLASLSQHIIR
jgi:lysozyme